MIYDPNEKIEEHIGSKAEIHFPVRQQQQVEYKMNRLYLVNNEKQLIEYNLSPLDDLEDDCTWTRILDSDKEPAGTPAPRK